MSAANGELLSPSSSSLPVSGNPLFTVKEAAAELHCSASFVYKLMRTGQLAYERRGRRKLPTVASVSDYRSRSIVAAQKQVPSPAPVNPLPYRFKHLFQKKNKPASTERTDS